MAPIAASTSRANRPNPAAGSALAELAAAWSVGTGQAPSSGSTMPREAGVGAAPGEGSSNPPAEGAAAEGPGLSAEPAPPSVCRLPAESLDGVASPSSDSSPAAWSSAWERLGRLADGLLGASGTASSAGSSASDPTSSATPRSAAALAPPAATEEARGRLEPLTGQPVSTAPVGLANAAAEPAPSGWSGSSLATEATAVPAAGLDAGELAELVNEALVGQARRHGVDLS